MRAFTLASFSASFAAREEQPAFSLAGVCYLKNIGIIGRTGPGPAIDNIDERLMNWPVTGDLKITDCRSSSKASLGRADR